MSQNFHEYMRLIPDWRNSILNEILNEEVEVDAIITNLFNVNQISVFPLLVISYLPLEIFLVIFMISTQILDFMYGEAFKPCKEISD